MTRRPNSIATARSLLFAPANEARKVARIGDFGSDAVVLDLEDAVAESERHAAREGLREALHRDIPAVKCVRINSWRGDAGRSDLAALPVSNVDAVVVPKVESLAELTEIDQALSGMEADAGLEDGRVALVLLIETAVGVCRLPEITSRIPARVARLIFGSGDYTADIGVPWVPRSLATLTARQQVVAFSRSAGLPKPIDGPYLDIHDFSGLEQDCRESAAMGFAGRVVVYPKQVEVVQSTYGTGGDLESALRIVEAFEAALERGSASIQLDGRFIDYPIYEEAQRRVAAARGDGA